MAGLTCTVDVITWLDGIFVYIGVKPAELSNLIILLLMGAD
jgi:hypothetical protein